MLAIVDQPIPQVIFKGKNIEDQYAVSLVLGSGQEIQLASKIKAALVSEERNWKPYVVVMPRACVVELSHTYSPCGSVLSLLSLSLLSVS